MLKLALTGGIACGKSLVGQWMAREGLPVCETDQVGHTVLDEDRSVRQALEEEFGKSIVGPDGRIDRGALGRMVFADSARRERLNALTHPAILKRTADWVQAMGRTHACVVAIIPLLYEVGLEKDWDRIVCVAAPEADQLQRLADRGLSPDEARARIAAQMSLAVKMERADHVIYNCGSMMLLEEQTKRVVRTIRGV
jgi:dephospho-CoA kinase